MSTQATVAPASTREIAPVEVTRTDAVVIGAIDALESAIGRRLSGDEIKRIVAAGPHSGRSVGDPVVVEWLRGLHVEYVTPSKHQSAWEGFVEAKVDAEFRVPEWLDDLAVESMCSIVDLCASESLEEAGWAWTVADGPGIDFDDSFREGVNPLAAEGLAGFVFRTSPDASVHVVEV